MSSTAAKVFEAPSLRSRRGAFAYLLHALNQPLTGLQCSLELAAAQPRSAKEYAKIAREGLELVSRMRTLAEALGTIAEIQSPQPKDESDFFVDDLLATVAEELQPVAEAKHVTLKVVGGINLPVRADQRRVQTAIFQLLDVVLSLAKEQTDFRITASRAGDHASINLAWRLGTLPDGSPFSRQELGLLIAQHGWESAGGEWNQSARQELHTCCLKMPLLLR